MSRFAVWSNRLALFALATAALSVIVLRGDLLEIVPAMATFGASLVLAVLAILCSFAAAVVIWREGLSGIGRAVSGVLIGCALLAYPAYLGYLAYEKFEDVILFSFFLSAIGLAVIGLGIWYFRKQKAIAHWLATNLPPEFQRLRPVHARMAGA